MLSIYFAIFLLIFQDSQCKKNKLETILQAQSINVCPMNDQLPMRFSYVKLVNQGRGLVGADAELIINKTIDQLFALIKVERCTGVDGASCEHFIKMADVDLCYGATHKMVETVFFGLFEPSLSCPTKLGVYKFNMAKSGDALLNTVKQLIVPDSKYYWKFQFKIFDGKKKLSFCIKMSLRILERKVVERRTKT